MPSSPSDLLAQLRAAGLDLTVSAEGRLDVVGPPATLALHRETLRAARAELVEELLLDQGQDTAQRLVPEPQEATAPPPPTLTPPPARRGRYGPPVRLAEPAPPPPPEPSEEERRKAWEDALAVETRSLADEDARRRQRMADPSWSPNTPRGK